jgi:CheY-like chemotaxis protein
MQSTLRLSRLLSDILDISRVEAGKMQIMAEPFDLREAVLHTLDLQRPLALHAGVELAHHIDPAIPEMVIGDATRVQQVLINLIGNALKFTAQGGVTLEAYPLSPRRPDQVRVFFSIADTGCGMPEEALEKLFAPFTQISQGYARNHQGAGLGLSICKRLVTLMGGNIAVESEVGVGTTMYFCITFGRADEADRTAPASAVGGADAAPLRILLVEDDDMSLVAARDLLRKGGFAVTTARNGREVLGLLEKGDFDLILMDIQLPVMDGMEAAAAIRSLPEFKGKASIPIIAMTAYAMAGDREKFLAAGLDGYIAKPVSTRDLHAEIGRVMARAQGGRASVGAALPR